MNGDVERLCKDILTQTHNSMTELRNLLFIYCIIYLFTFSRDFFTSVYRSDNERPVICLCTIVQCSCFCFFFHISLW